MSGRGVGVAAHRMVIALQSCIVTSCPVVTQRIISSHRPSRAVHGLQPPLHIAQPPLEALPIPPHRLAFAHNRRLDARNDLVELAVLGVQRIRGALELAQRRVPPSRRGVQRTEAPQAVEQGRNDRQKRVDAREEREEGLELVALGGGKRAFLVDGAARFRTRRSGPARSSPFGCDCARPVEVR